jgi:hypothetical protein|tara:strand:+ start:143 stop:409 length:267 start_codon:yes stop_codon:yes gene_type:complete
MQKVINVLAVLSFVGVAGIIGGGVYVYTQRDALIESAKGKIAAAATEAIAGALPGMLDAAMPELPNVTGGAVPVGEGKGGSVPGMRLP